jgi:hypothetical protein
MSLTQILMNQGELGVNLRQSLDKVLPKPNQFKTQADLPAFNSTYPTLAPHRLNREDSRLVEIAFNYFLRFITSKETDIPIDHSSHYFFEAFNYIEEPERSLVINRLNGYSEKMNDFFISEEIDDYFIAHLYTFAKLDCVAKKRHFDDILDLKLIEKKTTLAIIEDIKRLGNIYKKVFIGTNIINSDSFIIYNPQYSSELEKKVRGFDSSFFYDGVLLNIKTNRVYSYDTKDVYSLIAQYIFHLIDKALNAKTELAAEQIEQLALYKARAGQIEFFNVSDLNKMDVYNVSMSVCQTLNIKIVEENLIQVVSNIY